MSFNAQSDFIGDVNITQSSDITTDLNQVITEVEKKMLRLLLGDNLYLLLIADLTDWEPQNAPYIKLVDGEDYEVGDRTYIYEGIKKMLRYFVFAEWKMNNYASDTNTGTVRKTKELSDNLTKYEIEKESNQAWNRGVDLYKQCYYYLDYNSSDFETWDYVMLRKRNHFDVL